jgi:hypothetical protein
MATHSPIRSFSREALKGSFLLNPFLIFRLFAALSTAICFAIFEKQSTDERVHSTDKRWDMSLKEPCLCELESQRERIPTLGSPSQLPSASNSFLHPILAPNILLPIASCTHLGSRWQLHIHMIALRYVLRLGIVLARFKLGPSLSGVWLFSSSLNDTSIKGRIVVLIYHHTTIMALVAADRRSATSPSPMAPLRVTLTSTWTFSTPWNRFSQNLEI